MPRRKLLKPRKSPSQSRAKETVDAILQAGAYILIRDGWEGFTTNRVAERAGVNIASLYQYFSNKESIAVELQRRHIEKGQTATFRYRVVVYSQQTDAAALDREADSFTAEYK